MGLLDDAIREHLDLKRRHGATEDEIARKEAEALGPVRRVVSREDEDEVADDEDVEGAIAADPDFRSSGSPAADGEDDPDHPYASEDPPTTHDRTEDDLGWETSGPADYETRVLRPSDSEQPLEEDDYTRGESAAADYGDVGAVAAGDESYDDDRTRVQPAAAEQPFDDDERPAGRGPRLARVDDEPFADGEPGAVAPPEETNASFEPEAADFTPPAYAESYDPLDPLFDVAPEPEPASGEGPDWVSRPAPADEETPREEPPSSHSDATPSRAAYRVGSAPVEEESEVEWIDSQPSPSDDVRSPEDADTAFPHADDPPRRAGPGGSRAAGGADPAADGQQSDSPDVLEKTPDFLQETPEHDRLWFEQRPPRDFDFDD